MIGQQYVIASTARTGSQLLCEALHDTAIAGHPVQPFFASTIPHLSAQWGLPLGSPFDHYLAEVIRNGTTENGVFGVKIHWDQTIWLNRQVGGDALTALFPVAKYIHLNRRDRRSQAISLYRGQHTRRWWNRSDKDYPPMPTKPDPPFDSMRIRELERILTRYQMSWTHYFSERSIEPLIVEYESLWRNLPHEISRILTFLDLDPTVALALPPPRFLPQADATTLAWRRLLETEDLRRVR